MITAYGARVKMEIEKKIQLEVILKLDNIESQIIHATHRNDYRITIRLKFTHERVLFLIKKELEKLGFSISETRKYPDSSMLTISWNTQVKLTETSTKKVKVLELTGGRQANKKLISIGILPDTEITVIKKYKQTPLVLQIKETQILLGYGLAEKIIVEENE